jgi:hypothetical protein
MIFENLTLQELNSFIQSKNCNLTSEEYIELTKVVGNKELSEQEKLEIRKSFEILTFNMENKLLNNEKTYERLKLEFPDLFLYSSIEEFEELYTDFIQLGSDIDLKKADEILCMLGYSAYNLSSSKHYDKYKKDNPHLPLEFCKKLFLIWRQQSE